MYGKLACGPIFLGLVVGIVSIAGSDSADAAAPVASNLVTAPSALQSVPLPAQAERTLPPFQLVPPDVVLPAAGAYTTNDAPAFTIDRLGGYVRLRFAGADETFYLTSEPAAMGGRVLKYDTGEVALQVAGWGGVTLYTSETPSGIPAEHQPPSAPTAKAVTAAIRPAPPPSMKSLAEQLSKDIATRGPFRIGFSADFEALARQSEFIRSLALEAMRNAAYALERMADERRQRSAAQSLRSVRVGPADQPGVTIQNDSLVVTYAPDKGPAARPSSLAIARLLARAF